MDISIIEKNGNIDKTKKDNLDFLATKKLQPEVRTILEDACNNEVYARCLKGPRPWGAWSEEAKALAFEGIVCPTITLSDLDILHRLRREGIEIKALVGRVSSRQLQILESYTRSQTAKINDINFDITYLDEDMVLNEEGKGLYMLRIIPETPDAVYSVEREYRVTTDEPLLKFSKKQSTTKLEF